MEVAYSFKQSNLIHGVDSKWYNSDFFHPKLGFRYNNSRAASRVCLRRIGSVIGSISISGGSVPFGRDFDGLPSGKGGPLCQGNDAVVYVEGNGKSVEVGKDSDGCDSDKSLVVEGAPLSAKMVTESSAKVIDGKSVAKQIREEIAVEIAKMKEATGIVPGLAVILVGDRKDSATYVRNKKKACDTVGINSFEVHLPENTTEQEVLKSISRFNEDPMVHGILVQLPLPSHMNEEKILNAVGIEKDVDGFHPLNIGRLAMRGREPSFVPCTPKGCIELLHRYGIQIKGKKAVVVGRSNIVGMPAALLLQREDATVTIVHSRTNNPEDIIKEADIIISAVGQANMIRGSWIKPGAVIIDVGINPVEDSDKPRGYRLVGDVCYEEVVKVASAITPVPGGVGPMTIAMLLSNTLSSAKRIHNFNS